MAIHSRSVSEALYELGKDKTYNPSYTGRAMQPLEAVRHFASNDILSRTRWMGEPPALLHGSKYGSGHFLYGTEVPAIHEDVAYRDGNAPPQDFLFKAKLCGAFVMRVHMEETRPVLVYWKERERKLIFMVLRAPLGKLEAVLSNLAEEASDFEKRWMEGQVVDVMEQRRQVFASIRRCGMDNFPTFLISGNYHLERHGVLPLLRLSRPENAVEEDMCLRALASAPDTSNNAIAPTDPTTTMAEIGLLEREWTATTVFMTGDASDLKTGKCQTTPRDWRAFLNASGVSRLAMGILNQMYEQDYWGPSLKTPVNPGFAQPEMMAESEDMQEQRISGLQPCEAPATLSSIFAMTQRVAELSDVIVQYNRASDAVLAIGAALFQDRDRPFFEGSFGASINASGLSSAEARVRKIARAMEKRFAILLIVVGHTGDDAGKVMSLSLDCQGVGKDGAGANAWNPGIDECVRLLLCPWVTPLIIRGNTLSRLRLQGVARQKLKLSEKTILEYMPTNLNTTALVSQADIATMQRAVMARLDDLEKKQQPREVIRTEQEESQDLKTLRALLPVLEAKIKRNDRRGISKQKK